MSDLQDMEMKLKDAERQIAYYKNMAHEVGEIRLRESLEMSELIEKIRKTEHALQESLETVQHAQKQLVEAEKNSAMTTVVAGIAHEINTPIGICITSASYLSDTLAKYKEQIPAQWLDNNGLNKILATAQEATELLVANLSRAAELIRSFKMVAVDQSHEEKRVFNVKEYLNHVLKTVLPEHKRGRCNAFLNCPDTICVDSYPGVFSQILTNLVMNSISHGFEDMDKGVITIDVTLDRGRLMLLYRDNGKGMSLEDLKHMYTPFFTTKRSKGGTGLGMHIVYNLVTLKLKGSITCESTMGKGISFLITIPPDWPEVPA